MISYLSILQATLYILIFVASILLANIIIDYRKENKSISNKHYSNKIKIVVITSTTAFLTLLLYFTHCHGSTSFLQCIYIRPGEELMRNIGIALFINTTLFLGGLHQELYNGKIKRKFLRFYKKQFQWSLFKNLFIVPMCVEVVFRALLCRIVDPEFEHTSFFTFFSGILFSVAHLVNYFEYKQKYGMSFSLKTAMIQVTYNLIFGLYVCHIFSKREALISSLVIQVYANFMGFPDYFQILKGNLEDDRARSKKSLLTSIESTMFYLIGVMCCLSCCLLL